MDFSSLFSGGGGPLGAVVSSAANLYGGMEQRAQQEDLFYQNLGAQKAANAENRVYNAHEAALARQFQAEQASSAMRFSSSEADKAREYTTSMSNSAHQREMADLRKAGLNPILAIAHGGASTPSSPSPSGATGGGAQASSSGSVSSSLPNIQNILGSAMEAARIIPEVRNRLQENENLKEQERLIAAQSARETASKMLLHEQVKKVSQETETEKHRTQVMSSGAEKAKSDAWLYGSKVGQWLRVIGTTGSEMQRILSGAGGARAVQQMME